MPREFKSIQVLKTVTYQDITYWEMTLLSFGVMKVTLHLPLPCEIENHLYRYLQHKNKKLYFAKVNGCSIINPNFSLCLK